MVYYISEIIFTVLPINDLYENVYDSKDKLLEIIEYVPEIKGKTRHINLGGEKRGFNANKNTSLTLENIYFSDANDLNFHHKFNYAIIALYNEDNGFLYETKIFYFIKGIELNNSNNVITFNLVYDEWTNNVDEIYNKNGDREQFIERLTYDGYNKLENGDYKYNGLINDEKPVCLTKKALIPTSNDDEGEGRPLFIKVTLDSAFPSIRIGAVPSILPLKVVYIPYGIVYKNEGINDIIEYFYYGSYKCSFLSALNTYSKDDITVSDFLKDIDLYALKKELTFFCPYSYIWQEIEYGGGLKTICFNQEIEFHFENVSGTNLPSILIMGFNGCYVESTHVYSHNNTRFGEIHNKEIDLSYTIKSDELPLSKIDYSTYMLQYRVHYYPYNYNSLLANGEEIFLIPHYNKQTAYLRYNFFENYISPKVKIYIDDENQMYTTLQTNGLVPISVSAENVYERDNKYREMNTRTYSKINMGISLLSNYYKASTGVVKTVAGAATGNAGATVDGTLGVQNAVFGGVQNVIDYSKTISDINALHKDLENMPSNVSFVQSNALNDVEYQDDILLFKTELSNDVEKKTISNYFERFGISFKNYAVLKQHNFSRFDFIQILNAEIELSDLDSLHKIRAIFSNGVRIWHISNYDFAFKSTEYQYSVAKCNYRYANIPMSIINGEGIIL